MSILSTKQTLWGVLGVGALGLGTWSLVRRQQEKNKAKVEAFKAKLFAKDPRYRQMEEAQQHAVREMLDDLDGKSWQDKLRTAGEGSITFVERGFDKEHPLPLGRRER